MRLPRPLFMAIVVGILIGIAIAWVSANLGIGFNTG
jgi:hypothetical protein